MNPKHIHGPHTPDGSRRRGRRAAIGFVLVILTAALAGCTGSDDVDPDGQDGPEDGDNANATGGSGDDGNNRDAGTGGLYRFSDVDLGAQVMTETGAISATETCLPVHCLTGDQDSYAQRIDLSPILTVGVPTQVDVDLETASETIDSIHGYFETEGAHWNLTPAASNGFTDSVIATLPESDATLYFVVEAGVPDGTDDQEWTLHAEATPMTERIPEGLVVGVEVDDWERAPTIRSTGFSVGTFMLWDPDDEYVGTYRTDSNTSAPFNETGKSGEYVLFVPWNEEQVEIEAHAEAADPALLRPLGMSRTLGEFHVPAPESPAEWDFQVEPTALAVGLLFYGENGYTNIEESLRFESPAGVIHDGDLCGICISPLGASENLLWVDASHTVVVPGTYEVHYENSGHGTQVADIVWDYER